MKIVNHVTIKYDSNLEENHIYESLKGLEDFIKDEESKGYGISEITIKRVEIHK